MNVFIGAALLMSVCLTSGVGMTAAHADAVSDALTANRHAAPSAADLEQLAGGREALIARLIELRNDNETPLLGTRAAKLLLENFHGEANIAAAFEEDISRDDHKGIAQLIAMNIDKVPSAGARLRLAQSLVEKAKHDANFVKYAKSLTTSSDASVKQLAKELP